MSGLRQAPAEYLTVRRTLGYKLEGTERLLGQFLDYLDAAGADRITVEHAVAWATLPGAGQHWHAMRLGAVRGFARYLHEVDPRVEVPPADLVPDRPRRAVPYLYTDEQILALIEAAGTLRAPHKTATFRTLFGLLIATGMRIGEASAGPRRLRPCPRDAHHPQREVRQVAGATAAPDDDQRADWLPASPGPSSAGGPDRGAADLDRRHQAVHQRRGDLLPGAASPRGDPAALGRVPAEAA